MSTHDYRLFRTLRLPFPWSRATALGLLSAMALCLFAPRTGLSQNSTQRDQEAITILQQTLASAGGQQLLTSIQDFTETGTVMYNLADDVTGNLTVIGRGLHQFRIDADLPNGRRTTVVNGEGGSLTEETGKSIPISPQSAADLGGLTLPYLSLLEALRDSYTSIVYVGLVNDNGTSAHDIRLIKVYTKEQDPSGHQGIREARDFYLDPKTYMVVAISDQIYHGGKGVSHEIVYSDYELESGIAMPLTITERVHGVAGFTMHIRKVTFNSGMTN